MHKISIIAGAVLASTLVLTGCSSESDSATETIIQKQAEEPKAAASSTSVPKSEAKAPEKPRFVTKLPTPEPADPSEYTGLSGIYVAELVPSRSEHFDENSVAQWTTSLRPPAGTFFEQVWTMKREMDGEANAFTKEEKKQEYLQFLADARASEFNTLVKVAIDPGSFGPYDFDRKGFPVSFELGKYDGRPTIVRTNATLVVSDDLNIDQLYAVDDLEKAKQIEDARTSSKVTAYVYGHIGSIEKVLDKRDRYWEVSISPHFLEIQAGEEAIARVDL